MARNKPSKPLAEAPPEPESSSEQISGSSTEPDDPNTADPEVSSAASSSAEEDDEEELQKTPSTPAPVVSSPLKKSTAVKKPTPQPPSSSEESESDDEPPLGKLKPVSKPVIEPKSRSKPTDKRPSEIEKEKPSSKRIKKDNTDSKLAVVSPAPNEEKKLFQRVFSEEDEIEILKGLIVWKERNGGDPMKNDDEYYGFIKKKLHVEVNKAQVIDKVKRLKRKFINAKKNSKKKNVSGHEKKLFELSNKIWEVKDEDEGDVKANGGNNVDGVTIAKENDNVKSGLKDQKLKSDNGAVEGKKKSKEVESEGDEMDEGLRVGEGEVKEAMRAEALKRMGKKGRAEIREMWRKVEVAQLEVDLMRSEAHVQEKRMIIEALEVGKR